MILRAPQIILIVMTLLSLGISMAKHGEVKMETKNFWSTLIATLIELGLLYWGGFLINKHSKIIVKHYLQNVIY